VVVVLSVSRDEIPAAEDLWRRLGLSRRPTALAHAYDTEVWKDSPEYVVIQDFLKHNDITHTLREEAVYSRSELAGFEFLHLTVTTYADCDADDCGPVFDKSAACPACGLSGWKQISPVIINKKEMGKKDLAITYGFEYLLSDRLKQALEAARLTGCSFMPVRHMTDRLGPNEPVVWQIVSAHVLPRMVPPTVLKRAKRYCETCGHTGVYLKSEPYYSRDGFVAEDINFTGDCFGERPYSHPRIILSQRVYRLLKELKVRNFKVEPVHLT